MCVVCVFVCVCVCLCVCVFVCVCVHYKGQSFDDVYGNDPYQVHFITRNNKYSMWEKYRALYYYSTWTLKGYRITKVETNLHISFFM